MHSQCQDDKAGYLKSQKDMKKVSKAYEKYKKKTQQLETEKFLLAACKTATFQKVKNTLNQEKINRYCLS